MRSRRDELFAAYNFSIQHARDQCFTELAGAQYCDSLVLKHAVVPQSRTGVARSQTAPTVLIPYCRGVCLLRLRAIALALRGPPAVPPRFSVKRKHSIVSPRNVNRTYWQKCGGQRRSCSIPADEKFLLLLAL